MNYEPGQVITVRYPFVRCLATDSEDGHVQQFDSWRPGVYAWGEDPYTYIKRAMADGAGQMILTVVSIHKPGKYPTRVFYTRSWVTPDGKTFGKPALRVCTAAKFERLASGYRCLFGVYERDRSEWAA